MFIGTYTVYVYKQRVLRFLREQPRKYEKGMCPFEQLQRDENKRLNDTEEVHWQTRKETCVKVRLNYRVAEAHKVLSDDPGAILAKIILKS
jgi:hypothetical protein